MKPKYILYIDMDGVLCDFLKGAGDIVGMTFDTHMDWEKVKHTEWKTLANVGAEFWANLPWTKDGKELWDFVSQHRPRPNILSAFPQARGNKYHAIHGKNEWIDNNLTDVGYVHLVRGQEKQDFATARSILVDDSPRNIEQFNEKGGIGILHTSTESTIRQLKEILEWED